MALLFLSIRLMTSLPLTSIYLYSMNCVFLTADPVTPKSAKPEKSPSTAAVIASTASDISFPLAVAASPKLCSRPSLTGSKPTSLNLMNSSLI